MIKIGVVNIDVSHPKAFSAVLMKENRARYSAVYNEGFRSIDEVEGFRKLAGLKHVCSSIDELVACSDVGFIQACNWDKHLPHALPFLRAGKPVFIDKPLAGNLRDCRALLELEQNGAVIMGSSSVRYCNEITDFLNTPKEERGELLHAVMTVGVDAFNYAIHAIEGLCAIAECKPLSVKFLGGSAKDEQRLGSYYISFENGATATCLCVEPRFLQFHLTILTTKKDYCLTIDNSKLYDPLLHEICCCLEGKPHRLASVEQLIWPIRVLLAGKLSAERGGETVAVWDPELEHVSFDGHAFEQKYAGAASPMYLL